MRLTMSQAYKRLTSLEYFVSNSFSGFYLYTNDDTVVWAKNLKYLLEEVIRRNLTETSHFIWGNCMNNAHGTFLQGAAGYLMSRYTAGRLLAFGRVWLRAITLGEDVAFADLMAMAGLTSMRDGTSEYMMGQYLAWHQLHYVQTMNLSAIQTCKRFPPRTRGCRRFFQRFNRIAVFHQLTGAASKYPVIRVYRYPDNLYWFQNGEMSEVCVQR